MAKKPVAELMPIECCGVCTFTRDEKGDLLCYGNPPVILTDGEGNEYSIRGCVVMPMDPICHIFAPRLHS